MTEFRDHQIKQVDTTIFSITTAMSQADKAAFLELQNIVGSLYQDYCYLEVGSDCGGSIIAPLFDSRCGVLISVDLRIASQPDERGRAFPFPNNTTANMLNILAAEGVSEKAIARLRTFDADIGQLPFWRIGTRARFAFVDAEHTNQAAFRDWLNVSRFIERDAIVVFHDANLIFDALENIQAMLRYQSVIFTAYYLPDTIFALALGSMAEEVGRAFKSKALDPASFIAGSRAALNAEIAHSLSLHRPGH